MKFFYNNFENVGCRVEPIFVTLDVCDQFLFEFENRDCANYANNILLTFVVQMEI